jgi:hypothetical protein
MRQVEQAAGMGGAESKRVEVVVETLAQLRSHGETLAEVAHDARNMVTALGLYCDLLEEPGVLTPQYRHFGSELRLVATASRRLVEKLVTLDTRLTPEIGASLESIQLPEIARRSGGQTDRRRSDQGSGEYGEECRRSHALGRQDPPKFDRAHGHLRG